MKIIVNGENKDVADGISLAVLMEVLALTERRVVIELNQTIVDRSDYSETVLADNDCLEIIQFVPGG